MKSLALPAALAALVLPAAHGAVLINDSFDGPLNTTNWVLDGTNGSAAATFSGGAINLNNGINSTSQRIAIGSTATTANPFASPVTISLSGLSLTSASTSATSIGFIVLGRMETDADATFTSTEVRSYSPTSGASYDGSGALALNFFRTNSTGAYLLRIYDHTDSTSPSTIWNLSAMPTGISWTIDGATKSYSFNLTGATISAGGTSSNGVGTGTGTGTWTNFNAADLAVGDSSISRVIVGSVNSGALDVGTSTLFAVSDLTVTNAVSNIPEPSSFALLASAFVGGLAITRRRRR